MSTGIPAPPPVLAQQIWSPKRGVTVLPAGGLGVSWYYGVECPVPFMAEAGVILKPSGISVPQRYKKGGGALGFAHLEFFFI